MMNHRHNNVNTNAITITEYATPSPLDWINIICMLALFSSAVASSWITPGHQIWNLLTQYIPGGPERVLWAAHTFVPLLALAHAAETVLFDRLRMQRHGVMRWSGLWWKWEISCFVEGIRAWKRIDKVVAHEKRE